MAEIYWAARGLPGSVGVARRPRGGHFLAEDMSGLRARGVDILISALPPEEARTVWLAHEREAAEAAGIEFVHFPVPNLLTPPLSVALPLLQDVAKRIRSGAGVASHCHAGIGRSPLLAASLLALLDHSPADAWELVRSARGVDLPDTDDQYRWVFQLVNAQPPALVPRRT